MTTGKNFGQRLKRLRTARRLRVVDLGYAAGVTEGAIRQMESGQTKGASLVIGLRLAKLLGVTPDYLAYGTDGSADDQGTMRLFLARLDEHEHRLAKVERRLTTREG